MNDAESTLISCPECEAKVEAGSVFCPKCGVRLQPEEPGVSDRPVAEAAPRERFMAAAAEKQANADEPEDELWEGSYAKQAMVGSWIAGGVATIAALFLPTLLGVPWLWLLGGIALLWVVLVCVYLYRRHSIRYRLTNHRLLYDKGILSRTRERLELIDVDDVTVFQGVIERLVGVGRIVIHSSDVTDGELKLIGIENAREVADVIDDARRKERRRRGLHIEAV